MRARLSLFRFFFFYFEIDYIFIHALYLIVLFSEAMKVSALSRRLTELIQLLAIINYGKVIILENSWCFYGTDSLGRFERARVVERARSNEAPPTLFVGIAHYRIPLLITHHLINVV